MKDIIIEEKKIEEKNLDSTRMKEDRIMQDNNNNKCGQYKVTEEINKWRRSQDSTGNKNKNQWSCGPKRRGRE